jgi:hypothetical protein
MLDERESIEVNFAPGDAREFEHAPSHEAVDKAVAALRNRVRGG